MAQIFTFEEVSQPSNTFSFEDATSAAPQGFAGRVGADLSKRWDQVLAAKSAEEAGRQGQAVSAFDVAGAGVGAATDIIGNALGSAGRYANEKLTKYAPDVKAAGQDVVNYLGDTYVAKGIKNIAGSDAKLYGQFAQDNPDLARHIGAAGNLASILPIGRAAGLAGETVGQLPGQALSEVGQGLTKWSESQAARQRSNFAKDLVMPKETKAVLEDQVDRTTLSPILKSKIVEPTLREQAAIEQVAQIPGVKPGNSFQANWNIINDVKNTEAESLLKNLQGSKIIYNPAELGTKLDEVLGVLKTDPLIVGDSEKVAERVVNKMSELVQQNKGTPAGLLKARQEFDSWAQSKKGSVFDSGQTAFSSAVRDTRQAANDFLGELVPDAAVKASLQKQSLLYHALDNVGEKAAGEGKNRVSRFAQKAGDIVPIKNPLIKYPVEAAALGGLGTAAVLAPAITVGALGLYGAQKVLRSPALKKAIGGALDKTGRTIRNAKPALGGK